MTGPNSPHYFSPLKNAKNAQKILPKISKISKMRIFAVPPQLSFYIWLFLVNISVFKEKKKREKEKPELQHLTECGREAYS